MKADLVSDLQGILNCRKPRGWTSRDVVNRVYRRLKPAKVGHAGTLDPLADGVLLLVVGGASRLVPYIHLYNKSYKATFTLGQHSPSADLETPVTLELEPRVPTAAEVLAAMQTLTGWINQIPPIHSAVKIGGKPAYKSARKNQAVEMRSRCVQVKTFELLRYEYPCVETHIICSSGTYIRTLGLDLAAKLNTTAVMTGLTRTAIGPFNLDASMEVEDDHFEVDVALLRPLADGIGQLGVFYLDAAEVIEVEHGRSVRYQWEPPGTSPNDEWAAIDPAGRLRAILIRRDGAWGPKRVFPDA